MEFNQKLQELRKHKGMTQEELAKTLYVSRTAISKWESGRGYPSIESLRAIAKFFSVSVDDLLSSNDVLTLAEEEGKQKEKRMRDLIFGLLDVSMLLLLFLPFFATRIDNAVINSSLVALDGVQPYVKIIYFCFVVIIPLFGVLTLVLQASQGAVWLKIKTKISLFLGTFSVLIFIVTLQPYAAAFAFVLITIKAIVILIKRA